MQQLFDQVAHQFVSLNQYEKFVKQASKEYDIKKYRLHLFAAEHASVVYKQLKQRYQNKLVQRLACGWNENERKLYVWFIVCYIHLKLLDSQKLVDNQKHWKHISHVFWDKDIFFLKYQLHTIIKTRGRTVWKPHQDQLLKEIHQKHDKGEWNQIAKQFYFLSKGNYFKSPKQCRQRWQNHLNNQITKTKWSAQEDRIIFQEVQRSGTKWARIVPLLKNSRTQHMIKNRYKALLNREMQGKNLSQMDAIKELLRKVNRELGQNEGKSIKIESSYKKTVQLKKHEKVQIQPTFQQIQFFESEEIIDSDEQTKRKRGRPKKETKQPQIKSSKRLNSLQKNHNLQRLGQFQGCVVLGPQMTRLQQYFMNSQNSNSMFGQSNSFFRSSSRSLVYNSALYSMNNSFKLLGDNKSFMALDQLTIKQEKSEKIEKKQLQNMSLRSFDSIKIRPNESFVSKLINS